MKLINIQDNKNNIVKKHNDLIRAKGQLSQTAQKMLAMLISMIRADDTEFQQYALHIDSYKKEIDSKSKKSKMDFVEQARELMSNPFVIDKKMFNWCSKVDWGSLDGYIVFDIHKDLKPYLLELKDNFTQYNLVNILHLRGEYLPRLYELFIAKFSEYKHYNKSAKSYSFDIKIDELRELISISNGYLYADIKRRILDKAKKQFKQKTNIQFDYKEQKIGKKVDRLIITIKDNTKGSNDYLSNLHSFIAYMRKHFVNKDILETKDKNTDRFLLFSIDKQGHLYNKYNPERKIDSENSQELWKVLYELAKDNKLECLKK